MVALALAALNRVPRGVLGALVYGLVGLAFFIGFVIWAYADQGDGLAIAILNPLPGTVRLATPLIFGALAGCLCERAGVINIAIEGQFLDGRVLRLGRLQPGLQRGDGPGRRHPRPASLVAALLGVFAMRYQVNQVVLGVVLVAWRRV